MIDCADLHGDARLDCLCRLGALKLAVFVIANSAVVGLFLWKVLS